MLIHPGSPIPALPRFAQLLEDPQVAFVAVGMDLPRFDRRGDRALRLIRVQAGLVAARLHVGREVAEMESDLLGKDLGELQLPDARRVDDRESRLPARGAPRRLSCGFPGRASATARRPAGRRPGRGRSGARTCPPPTGRRTPPALPEERRASSSRPSPVRAEQAMDGVAHLMVVGQPFGDIL